MSHRKTVDITLWIIRKTRQNPNVPFMLLHIIPCKYKDNWLCTKNMSSCEEDGEESGVRAERGERGEGGERRLRMFTFHSF